MKAEPSSAPAQDTTHNGGENTVPSWQAPQASGEDSHMDHSGYNAGGDQSYHNAPMEDDNYGPINVKEDG
jgi:RNA-binding protein Musashi